MADIPAIAQLEGPDVKVSVGLHEHGLLDRAVCYKTADAWACMSCSKKICIHTTFLQSESSFQAALAALPGDIRIHSKTDRKAWQPSPIGFRKIEADVIGADGESSQAAFGSQAYKRAAFGLSSLSGVHHAVPPSACICDQPHLVHIDGASEGKFDASRCCCGALCPKCGSAWCKSDVPDCDVRDSSIALHNIGCQVVVHHSCLAWTVQSTMRKCSNSKCDAVFRWDGHDVSVFRLSKTKGLTFEMLIEHVHSTLVTVVPDASS